MRTFSSDQRSTLSDRFDPVAPADPIPGGLIEEVSVSYNTDGALAVKIPEAAQWTKAPNTVDAFRELGALLGAVQKKIESQFGLALVPQTVTVIASGPSRQLDLPRLPYSSLTSVKTIEDGTRQGDISDDYYVLSGALRAKQGVAVGNDPIEVIYDGGYSEVPEQVHLAIKRMVTDHFDFRSDLLETGVEEIPRGARSILREFTN